MEHVLNLKCLICGKEYKTNEIDYVCPDHGNEGIVDVQLRDVGLNLGKIRVISAIQVKILVDAPTHIHAELWVEVLLPVVVIGRRRAIGVTSHCCRLTPTPPCRRSPWVGHRFTALPA